MVVNKSTVLTCRRCWISWSLCVWWWVMQSSNESDQSFDDFQRRSSHCCMWDGNNHRCSLSGTRDRSCMRLHPPAPGSDVQRRGGGFHDNTPAGGWEDGGSGREIYITIIIFSLGWGSGVEEEEVGASPSDVSWCSLLCCSLCKINSTPFNTETSHSLCDIEGERGPFSCKRLLSSLLWLMPAAVFYGVSFFFFYLAVSNTKAEDGAVGLLNEKLSEDVIFFNDCHF